MMRSEDMELKYKDSSIELWANTKHPGWDLKVRPAANVIPILPNGKILLMSERKGPDRVDVGFPGGMIEDGETAAEAAMREAAEELGIVVEGLQEITVVRTGFPDTSVSYFLGWKTGETEKKDWEIIEKVQEMTVDELFQMALDGKVSDSRQVVAILSLKKQVDDGKISLTR